MKEDNSSAWVKGFLNLKFISATVSGWLSNTHLLLNSASTVPAYVDHYPPWCCRNRWWGWRGPRPAGRHLWAHQAAGVPGRRGPGHAGHEGRADHRGQETGEGAIDLGCSGCMWNYDLKEVFKECIACFVINDPSSFTSLECWQSGF